VVAAELFARLSRRAADIGRRRDYYASLIASFPARLLPLGARPWPMAKDRFARTARCMPRRDGPATELRGYLDADLHLDGDLILTGDVLVPEGRVLRLAPGTVV